jgi:hypothetical protein
VLQQLLSISDAARVSLTLTKLLRHDIGLWALTGGLAVEIHCLMRGCPPVTRTLTDIDFVTGSFDAIPQSLAVDFLFRHIHPHDPPGKTILQFVDAESAVRIDVFRGHPASLNRCTEICLAPGQIRLISLEDLAARMARLTFDLAADLPVPSKHARDFQRLADRVDPVAIEAVWHDHRKPNHPESFAEASRVLKELILQRPHRLITPTYSQHAIGDCPRCHNTGAFQLANPYTIRDLIGYC